MKQSEKSEAVKHLEKKADRHNEHLQKLWVARKQINDKIMKAEGTGAFNNKYLTIHQIWKDVEPILMENGFLTLFNDLSQAIEDPKKCLFSLELVYVPTNTTIEKRIRLDLERATCMAVKSAVTYAQRILYSFIVSLPQEDDDAEKTMSPQELQRAIKVKEKELNNLKQLAQGKSDSKGGSNDEF
tara:strand:+ start:571 stop:1125 length:555 start_codon:yes stop_codon:yes gene_type:complete